MLTAPARADSRTLSREIASAYVASAARIGSWVIVSAVVYRKMGADAFALLALVRGTIGILNYTNLGLAPALIHAISRISRERKLEAFPTSNAPGASPVLEYESPPLTDPSRVVYIHAILIGLVSFFAGWLLVVIYIVLFPVLHHVPTGTSSAVEQVVFSIGLGVMVRLMGDISGALLQTRGRIVYDNAAVAVGEVLWALMVLVLIASPLTRLGPNYLLTWTAAAYLIAGMAAWAVRFGAAYVITRGASGRSPPFRFDSRIARGLVSFGFLVVAAQLADYLYAPTDYILINRLLPQVEVANYAPGVQIDAGLLLLVTGLASVLLPRTALAHAADDAATVRRYYVRGTLASVALLTGASALVWVLSPWIFQLWLGNTMPATRAILPLMLVNTVIGGSSAVGRSILLGTGRVKPFTIAVLVAGVTNVYVSWALVRYAGMGLRGIVLGTVVAVVGRCVLWMPWYVMRTIRASEKSDQSISAPVPIV